MTGAPRRTTTDVILVNWDNWADTVDCIDSLHAMDMNPRTIWVIDNASSTEMGASALATNVRVVRSERNLGFAGAVNLGLRHALDSPPDYVWILNNDTVVRADALRVLVDAGEHNPEMDFVGSWIVFHDRPDLIWFGGGEFRRLTGGISHRLWRASIQRLRPDGQTVRTDWITGCSMLVRRSVIARVGMLDESFFAYCEELDWQLRAGPKPKAVVVQLPLVRHKVGRSTGSPHSELVAALRARNYLKLMARYSNRAWPLWFARWAYEYVAKPALNRRLRIAAVGLRSPRLVGVPGEQIVKSLTHR